MPSISSSGGFNVFCVNIQGLKDKWEALLSFLCANEYCPFDVIKITETWLSKMDDLAVYDLSGYTAIHIPRMPTKC